jgi:membrane-associated protease RseP (regulator of RpoE activity)
MRGKSLNILLFALTVCSTYFIGGLWYSLLLIAILLAHEMGHFLMSRKHGVPASLPYFLPVPIPPFGTFGAIIKMKGRMSSRRALFDIGVAGPLMGLFVTIPAIVIGLLLSKPVPLAETQEHFIHLGDSLLFTLVEKIVLGDLPEGYDLLLHPIAYAGWVGLFVTALNLLPVGQLDGGHIAYALFGRKSKIVFGLTIMLWMGISLFFYVGWTLMIVLVLLFGFRHPPPLDDVTPLDLKRKILGGVVLSLFILSFTPVPFTQAPGGIKDILQSVLRG